MGRANNVGFGKFLIMILVTWLTPFPGLANLLFLWPYPYYRSGACAALGISIAIPFIIAILAAVGLIGLADFSFYIAAIIYFAMRVWMTLDAISAFMA
ncbi:MAG: hypothetical protein ACUZ8A_00920 [Candidatus Bathyanammoxibius sp.]|jgi:hypothetical protein